MKLDPKNLTNGELKDLIEEEELYEERLEQREAKKERRKIQHKNTKKMMRR